MQCGSKGDPEEIGNLNVANPARVRMDRHNSPNKRGQHQHNVNRGQKITFQSKLQRGKGKIENQIEQKRQNDNEGNLFFEIHPKNFPKRNSNQRVEKSPHRTKKPSRWRPSGFNYLRIPTSCFVHMFLFMYVISYVKLVEDGPQFTTKLNFC